MTDNDNIILEDFFKQAAQQQIEDNGFTERVMQHLPDETYAKAHRLSTLWTLFCVIVGAVLFFVFGGWQVVVGLYEGGLRDSCESVGCVAFGCLCINLPSLSNRP